MAIRYLLDTNAISDLAQGSADTWAHVTHLEPGDGLWTCFIVVGEWEYGLNAAPAAARRTQISAAGIPVFAALDGVWESSPALASMYGSLYATLRAAGTMIPTNDVWIASVALVQGAILVTSDTHFAQVPGLRIADWTRV